MDFLNIVMILLILAVVISGIVVLTGKDKWERLLGLSMVSAKVNMLIIIHALISGRSYYLDIALIFVILSYIGVKVLSEYMARERREVQ